MGPLTPYLGDLNPNSTTYHLPCGRQTGDSIKEMDKWGKEREREGEIERKR